MVEEFLELFRRFISGATGLEELATEIDSYDIWNRWQDNDAEIVSLRALVGRLELLMHELGEGRRTMDELRVAALDLTTSAPAQRMLSAQP